MWKSILAGLLLLEVLAAGPTRLQVENRVDPLGMDVVAPRLSWNLGSAGPMQQAYQVQAASSRALLDQGVADLWDSGMVVSGQSNGVVYEGAALQSRMRV